MPLRNSKFNKFWQELKRRKVIHVVVVYASSSYVLMELTSIVTEPLRLPDWTLTLVILILAIGFPIAIVFSWIYDVTRKGIQKTLPVDDFPENTCDTTESSGNFIHENSIAVLPFQDMSPGKDQEYFCDGMAEEILNILAQIESLKVVARSSSFAFKNKNEDIREVGKKLGVSNILEGSIRKSGDRIRITVQLISVSSGLHLWSEKYDREIHDIFAIQDEISLAIVERLKLKLISGGSIPLVKKTTKSIDSYLHFLKGNFHLQRTTPEDVKTAIGYYEQSIEADPSCVPGYCGIANSYWTLTFWGNLPPNQAYPVIIEQIQLAQNIQEDQEDLYYLNALISFSYLWDMEEAEDNFKKALKISPNSEKSHSLYSIFLSSAGRHDEAIAEAKKAAILDPLSSYYQAMVANTYNFAGKYDEAISLCHEATARFPKHFFFPYFLGFALHGQSKLNEAIVAYESALKLSDGAQLVITNLILAHLEAGNLEQADKWLAELELLSEKVYVLPSHFYKIYRAKGNNDLAFEWFERALEEHDSFIPLIRIHPYDILRFPDESRYMEKLDRAGLKF